MNDQIEEKIEKELRKVVNDKTAHWLEWNTRKEDIEKNLIPGEKMIQLPDCKVWVAYRIPVKNLKLETIKKSTNKGGL